MSAVEPASHDDGVGDTVIGKIATTLGVGQRDHHSQFLFHQAGEIVRHFGNSEADGAMATFRSPAGVAVGLEVNHPERMGAGGAVLDPAEVEDSGGEST